MWDYRIGEGVGKTATRTCRMFMALLRKCSAPLRRPHGPAICSRRKPSQDLDVPLDDEYRLLPKRLEKFLLELSHELSGFSCLARDDAVDDDLVSINDRSVSPDPFVCLREERERTELVQQLPLHGPKFHGLDRFAVVVAERKEQVIFFHRPRLPSGKGHRSRCLVQ